MDGSHDQRGGKQETSPHGVILWGAVSFEGSPVLLMACSDGGSWTCGWPLAPGPSARLGL